MAGIRCQSAALPRALRLYEALLALAPEAALWARAFLAWCEQEPEAPEAPRWLQEGLRRLLPAQLPALRAWLKSAEPAERDQLADEVASTCAPQLVEAWVEALWEEADEELRRVLSGAIGLLLDRHRVKSPRQRVDQLLSGARNEQELLRSLMGELKQEKPPKLSSEGLRIWRRLGSKGLPYQLELLEVAVNEATSDTEAWQAATRYLEAHPGDRGYGEVLRTIAVLGSEALAKRALALWLERRAGSVEALASAVMAAQRMNTPCAYLHPMLEAFLRVLAEQPSGWVPTEVVRRAQQVARDHGYRLRKRRAPRKKKEGAKAPADGAPRPKRKSRAKAAQPEPQQEPAGKDGEKRGRYDSGRTVHSPGHRTHVGSSVRQACLLRRVGAPPSSSGPGGIPAVARCL